MKHVGSSVVVVAVILTTAAVAAAAPAPTAPPSAMKNPAQMSVEELSRFQAPPTAKLQAQRLSAKIVRPPLDFTGPDLIVLDPIGEPGPRPSNLSGYNLPFPGWTVDWRARNQGNEASHATGMKIECDVTVVPPGSAQYNFLKSRWCVGLHPMSPVQGLAPAHNETILHKVFFQMPMYPCSLTNYPRPKITVTVDPSNVVHEKVFGEGNNVHTHEFCLSY